MGKKLNSTIPLPLYVRRVVKTSYLMNNVSCFFLNLIYLFVYLLLFNLEIIFSPFQSNIRLSWKYIYFIA